MRETHYREIAILRAFAFLAVVLQHVIATMPTISQRFAEDLFPTTAVLVATRFAVPAFVFITGFLVMGSLARSTTSAFLLRRTKTVVVPYLVWSTVYYVYWKLVHGHPLVPSTAVIDEFAYALFWGRAQYHLWFVVMIIQIYFLAPVLAPLVERCRGVGASTALFCTFAVAHASALFLYPEPLPARLETAPVFESLSTLRYQLFPLWLIYCIAGMLTAVHYARIEKILASRVGVFAIAAFALYSVALMFGLASTIRSGTSYRTAADASELYVGSMVPYALLGIAAGLALACRIVALPRVARWLEAISDRSYVGYLMHPLVIAALTWRGNLGTFDSPWNPLLLAVLLFVATTAVTLTASLALERLPGSLRMFVAGR